MYCDYSPLFLDKIFCVSVIHLFSFKFLLTPSVRLLFEKLYIFEKIETLKRLKYQKRNRRRVYLVPKLLVTYDIQHNPTRLFLFF